MKKSNNTPLSHFRLPDPVKSKLRDLAAVDSIDMTNVIIMLINDAYKARKDEIKDFKKLSANDKKTDDI